MHPARPRPIVRPRAGRRRLALSSCGSRALGAAPPRHPDLSANAVPGIPPSSRDSGPFTPLGKCPATAFLTLAPHKSVFSGHFSSGVTPTNPQLRNCCPTWLRLDGSGGIL